MLTTRSLSLTEYKTMPKSSRAAADPRFLQRALRVLAAWVNPETDSGTYWVHGQDTLTYGDQARWFQLKGTLATASAIITEDDVTTLDLACAVTGYERILELLSALRTAPPPPTRAEARTSLSAMQALRPGDNGAAITLLDNWLNDTSGYDQEVWPRARAAIEQNRLSDRGRFNE